LDKAKFFNFNNNLKFKDILFTNESIKFLRGNFWVNLNCVKRLLSLLNYTIVDLNFLKKRKINFRFFFFIDNKNEKCICEIKSRKFESLELFINLNLTLFQNIIFD
jgi:hypothetical protein